MKTLLPETDHFKNTVVLIFQNIQCLLFLMYSEVVLVLVSSGTQVQPQIILDLDYLPDNVSVSYDYAKTRSFLSCIVEVPFVLIKDS